MRNKPRYTEKVHARRLIQMLEHKWKDNELGCPAAKSFKSDNNSYTLWSRDTHPCLVCSTFTNQPRKDTCPCFSYESCEEAAKQAWLTLEEKGYI